MSPVNMFSSEWQKPFNISIGLHIIALVLAMLAPTLFERQQNLPEIYTVNLFTATEVSEPEPPAVKAPAPKAVAKPEVRKIQPKTKKPAISIKPSKPEAAPVVKKNRHCQTYFTETPQAETQSRQDPERGSN
jgi:hypothetical protein